MGTLRFRIYFALLLLPFSWESSYAKRQYNPLDYGLKNARSGVERYSVLYNTHQRALQDMARVSYKGIDTLEIEIPSDAKPIPLTAYTDFCGLYLIVKCKTKSHTLFKMYDDATDIVVDKLSVDQGNYSQYQQLRKGISLLLLTDKNLWVKNRRGYQYGHQRNDVIFIKGGKAKNTPVFPYNNNQTDLSASYIRPTSKRKVVKNIKFYRDENNTQIVNLISIVNQYNVELNNIEIVTPPQSPLTKDQAIVVANSYQIDFNNVKIEGTYSKPSLSGYGISMNNVCKLSFNKLKGKANWGIFGCNNVSTVSLKDCDINRFDIHCYGKDVVCENCIFRDLYNQFSSVTGEVLFRKCEFVNFVPFLFETTYDAYTDLRLTFKDCVVHAVKEKNYMIDARGLAGYNAAARLELQVQKYPKVIIDGLTINADESLRSFSLYRGGASLLNSGWIEKTKGIKKVDNIRFIQRNDSK